MTINKQQKNIPKDLSLNMQAQLQFSYLTKISLNYCSPTRLHCNAMTHFNTLYEL